MNLTPLVAARNRCSPRPSWCVLFTKAFGLVSAKFPELRRAYMRFPWGRFYEHPYSIVSLNVERRFEGENIILQCLIRRPETRTLAELERRMRVYQTTPVPELRWYRRARAMSRVPWPFRRWLWWAALNVFGRRRCHNYGTFSVSSVASQGAGILNLVPILGANLHYGMLDDRGGLDVRFTFDHRVLDGADAARVLVELERVLNHEIVAELTGVRLAAA